MAGFCLLHLSQWESTVFPWLLLLIIAVLLQPAHRDLQSDLGKITLASQVAETSNLLDLITQDDASSMRQWKFVGVIKILANALQERWQLQMVKESLERRAHEL